MEKKIDVLIEVIELSSEVCRNLAQSEDMVNNGEVQQSMLVLKRGTSLLKTCKKDCYEELKAEYGIDQIGVDEDASTLNLAVSLGDLINACAMLLKSELDNDISILLIIETLPTELMLSVVVLLIPYLMKVYTAIESLGFTIVQLQQHSIKVMRAEQIIKNKKDDNVVEDNNLVIKEQIESIKINKLKWYKFAFKDIAFYRGKINCLQGKNGCGKTSMIKCLLGLKDYDEASFVINEKYNVKNLYNYKEKIGISFQDDMFFDRPIVDNIMYPKKQLNKKAKELVGVFNLNEVLKRKDKQNFFNTEFENNFSGGEKKKMSLIRNLKDDKEIYIFDEPTNDLDAQSIDNFIEIIKELCNKDKMIIIISHDKKILQVSDNIIKL